MQMLTKVRLPLDAASSPELRAHTVVADAYMLAIGGLRSSRASPTGSRASLFTRSCPFLRLRSTTVSLQAFLSYAALYLGAQTDAKHVDPVPAYAGSIQLWNYQTGTIYDRLEEHDGERLPLFPCKKVSLSTGMHCSHRCCDPSTLYRPGARHLFSPYPAAACFRR